MGRWRRKWFTFSEHWQKRRWRRWRVVSRLPTITRYVGIVFGQPLEILAFLLFLEEAFSFFWAKRREVEAVPFLVQGGVCCSRKWPPLYPCLWPTKILFSITMIDGGWVMNLAHLCILDIDQLLGAFYICTSKIRVKQILKITKLVYIRHANETPI